MLILTKFSLITPLLLKTFLFGSYINRRHQTYIHMEPAQTQSVTGKLEPTEMPRDTARILGLNRSAFLLLLGAAAFIALCFLWYRGLTGAA
jgi:hypothetical protein